MSMLILKVVINKLKSLFCLAYLKFVLNHEYVIISFQKEVEKEEEKTEMESDEEGERQDIMPGEKEPSAISVDQESDTEEETETGTFLTLRKIDI